MPRHAAILGDSDMRPLLALLLAVLVSGCVTAPRIPDQLEGPALKGGPRGDNALAAKVGKVRENCRDARKALRSEARSLERRHNLWAVLGASFGASGGAAALGATADADKGVKNTLTITGALLSVAGAVATGVSSKDSDLLTRLSERALKIKNLESEVDSLVAKRKPNEDGVGEEDDAIARKVDELDEACTEP